MGAAAGPWAGVEALGGVTEEEAARLGRAMQDEAFRDLLMEHARELQEPAARARYEQEMAELERERGMDVTFLHISPGYVLKGFIRGDGAAASGGSHGDESGGTGTAATIKAFVNVCWVDTGLEPPTSEHSPARPGGVTWRLPHAVLPPARRDVDGRGAPCAVHDVAFHRDAAALAAGPDPRLRALLDDTAAAAVEDALGVRFVSRHNRGGGAARTGAVRRIKATYKGTPPLRSPVLRKPRAGAGEGAAAAAAATDGGFPFPPGLEMPYPYSGATTTTTTTGATATKIHGNRNRRRDGGGGGGAGGGVPGSSTCASESPTVTQGQPAAKDCGKAAGGLQYTVTHRTYSDMQDFAVDAAPRCGAAPHELVVRIDLAGACARCLAQPGAVRLEVGHAAMELTLSHAAGERPRQQEHRPCAHLIVPLPLPVVAGGGHAELNRDSATLTITVETLARKNAPSARRRGRSGAPPAREVGQAGAQGSRSDGQQPDTEADEQQPDTEADEQQLDTETDKQQLDTEADEQQPDTEADKQQPDTQADGQQSDTQAKQLDTQPEQLDTAPDEQQLDTQPHEQSEKQTDTQPEQADAKPDEQPPDTQPDEQQPDTKSEHPDTNPEYPDTQSKQPDTQGELGTQPKQLLTQPDKQPRTPPDERGGDVGTHGLEILSSDPGDHVTRCPIQFQNDLLFELD